mgnify:CR=1 FL=1
MNNENNMTHFHGDDVQPSSPEEALFHMVPVPFEKSVTYGSGTAKGPQAILEASSQLELHTCANVPAEHGIYTIPELDCSGSTEEVLQRIENTISTVLEHKALPVVLGGEHTVTCGGIPALQNHYESFGVIQFDAHADLRDVYEGTGFNHACVMRRIHEKGIPIYQIGTRSYSIEEQEYRKKYSIPFIDSEEIWRKGTHLELPPYFPEHVYVTFDIDALDSSILPATGTPVPGGLNWYQAMWMIEQIMKTRICIGIDVVELAPIENLHASSFAAAQLTYNLMGYLTGSKKNRKYWLIETV